MKSSQAGNVLFLILIAVALFAALAYVVAGSTRQGQSSSKETYRLYAATYVNFASSVRSAVQQVMLRSGCGEGKLNFANDVYKSTAGTNLMPVNASAPTDGSCDIFSPLGGGIIPMLPPEKSLTPSTGTWTEGHAAIRVSQIKNVGTDGPGGTTSANELYMSQGYINRDTCIAINDLLQVTNPDGEPPVGTTNGGSGGQYVNGSFGGSAITEHPSINGQLAYCGGLPGNYGFTFVVIAR